LEGLLTVVNLVREVVNGYGLMHQVVCSCLHHSEWSNLAVQQRC
jgi:hypothetical protein